MDKLKGETELRALTTEELESAVSGAEKLRSQSAAYHRMAARLLEERRATDRAAAAVAEMNDVDREALRKALEQKVAPEGVASEEKFGQVG